MEEKRTKNRNLMSNYFWSWYVWVCVCIARERGERQRHLKTPRVPLKVGRRLGKPEKREF